MILVVVQDRNLDGASTKHNSYVSECDIQLTCRERVQSNAIVNIA